MSLPTSSCTAVFGETFSQHVTRCGCELSAPLWADFHHQAHLDALAPKTGDGTVEQVAAEIADATVDTFLSLRRLLWLTDTARSGAWRDLPAQARIAFTAAALDRYLIDPELLLVIAADTRSALLNLLEHLGDIAGPDDEETV